MKIVETWFRGPPLWLFWLDTAKSEESLWASGFLEDSGAAAEKGGAIPTGEKNVELTADEWAPEWQMRGQTSGYHSSM